LEKTPSIKNTLDENPSHKKSTLKATQLFEDMFCGGNSGIPPPRMVYVESNLALRKSPSR